MEIIDYYIAVLKKYAVFRGRSQRAEYWYFVLVNFLVVIVLSIAPIFSDGTKETIAIGVLYALYSLAIIVPGMAVSVRRLHDTGRSGWWFFAPFILAVVLLVVSIFAAYIFLTSMFGQTNFSNELVELLFLVLPVLLGVFAISQIVLVVFFVFDSQPGDNKYGPNPKGVPANVPTAAPAPTESIAEIQQEPSTETNQ